MEILGIGEKLRELRMGRNLTLKQVSDRLGITTSSLSVMNWMKKSRPIRIFSNLQGSIVSLVIIFWEITGAALLMCPE